MLLTRATPGPVKNNTMKLVATSPALVGALCERPHTVGL
jgi:hypothetical protein